MRYKMSAVYAALLTMAAIGNAFAMPSSRVRCRKRMPRSRWPSEVSIEFDEEINPKLSLIVVQDATGQHVDKATPHRR